MQPWCIHFGGERNAKKNEKFSLKIQQAAVDNTISSSTVPVFFFKNQPTKKNKKIGEKNWRSYYRCTWCLVYVSHQGRFGQP